jgi:hypothetical protein
VTTTRTPRHAAAARDDVPVALEDVLSTYFGSPRRIVAIDRQEGAHQSSFRIEELSGVLEDGTELSVVFKNVGPAGLLGSARRVKPTFVLNPRREIEVYAAFVGKLAGPPACYGAVMEPERGRYWLFLENVAGPRLRHVGEFGVWLDAARWLAAMHASSGAVVHRAPPSLVQHDRDFYRVWMARARRFLRRSPHDDAMAWLAMHHEQVIDRLVALPRDLVHGEFYPSNVLIAEAPGVLRICPVDWEMAGVGPGLIDLAALAGGRWTAEQRQRLALAYWSARPHDGRWRPSADEFMAAFYACQLQLAVQWLGWSRSSVSRVRTHDWVAEALNAAERLGVPQ